MKRRGITLLLTMLISVVCYSYTTSVNGIYYSIYSDGYAVVTWLEYDKLSNQNAYSGNVVIPETVTYDGITYPVKSINSFAFKYCSKLTSVTIPNSVIGIGKYAFYGCSGLTSVNIPSSVTTIVDEAFAYCTGLTSVTIGNSVTSNSVTSIGNYAFKGCSSLTNVTIGNSVTSIGDYAFYGCSGLTSVTNANSVTSIGRDAFEDTSWYNNQPDGLVYVGKVAYTYKGLAPSVVTIGDGTVSIAPYAFSGCRDLTSVTIPNSLTSIGNGAFLNCTGLTSVTIPNSVTSIGSSAFHGCNGLKEVNFNATNCTKMGNSNNPVFSGCTSLTTLNISDNVQNIPAYAFIYCEGIKSITIPNSVTSIGEQAFYNTRLKSVTIGSGVLDLGAEVFCIFGDNYEHRPAKVIWLTNTPPSGYSNAAGRINYVANDQYSFYYTRRKTVYKFLSSIFEVDGIKYVPVSPSERTCDAIDCIYDETAEHINIGNTVTYKGVAMTVKQIHPYACYQNSHIKDVQLNCSGDVGEDAFSGCTALQTANVSNQGAIGHYTFSGCSALQTAKVSSQGSIGSNAFEGCSALHSAEVNNVGDIGDYAFYGCSSMETVTLGAQVSAIGHSAFSWCNSLQGIVIPNAVTSIGSYAFSNCSKMESVKMGNGVSAINSYAFHNCSSLNNMQIGSSVETIGAYAFNNCSSLPAIEIPQSVTKVDNNVFDGCTALKDVFFADRSSILTLGYQYYSNNSNNNKPLFADCPLDSVYIGGNINYDTDQYSGYSPFYRNTSLRSVRVTDQETEISENEFYGCTNLKNVWIGDGVTTIGNWAFSGCSSLDYFAFGASVETIGQEAFSDCTAVTKVISRAPTPPTCGSQALDDINKWECTLEVPQGMATTYQDADQWKEFFFVEEGDAAVSWYKIIYTVDGEPYKTVNVAEGAAVIAEAAPVKAGYTFTGWTGLPTTMPNHDVTVTGRLVKSDDPSTRFDLNNDGNIDMIDVTLLIDYILGRE